MLLAFCNKHGNQLDCNELQFKKKSMYIKKARMEPIHTKYNANKNTKTHAMKEHNNQDITITLIK